MVRLSGAFLVCFPLAVALQYASGAYGSAFSGYPDEPAHYVTGLMVRDYLAGRLPGSPFVYAQNYYLHYPEVALGQWPPGFYIIQALWSLPFSPSRTSMLLLMATLASLLAVAVWHVAREEWGSTPATVGALLLLAIPLNQMSTNRIMAEIPGALLGFLAILALGRYVEHQRWIDAGGFGLLASLAILTKGTALSLALAPPMAALLSRRLGLMRRLSFWLPAVIVLIVCGPWYVLTARAVVSTFIYPSGTAYTVAALGVFGSYLLQILGLALFPLACLGAVMRLRRESAGAPISGRWASIVALPSSIFLFHVIVSAGYEDRYLVAATPALVLLLLAGIASVAACLPQWSRRRAGWHGVLGAACGIVFLATAFNIPQKRISGYVEAAEAIMARAVFQHSVILVSSHGVDGNGEGMLIAEIAMRERRPGHYVLRATKALAQVDWNATEQRPFYHRPEEVMGFLDSVPVGVLVLDTTPSAKGFLHHDLLLRTVQAYPGRFVLVSAHAIARTQGPTSARPVHVYRVVGNENPAPERVHLDRQRLLSPRAVPWW